MVKKNKTLWIPHLPPVGFFLMALLNFSGCTFGNLGGQTGIATGDNYVHEEKNWTFMVYMAADNNLESAAVEDFNEMEASDFDFKKGNVIVLFDRNDKKDCTDKEEWSGTRMYEISRDANGMNNSICSTRIPCSNLGLLAKKESSLDMGSPETMSGFIENVKKYYPAKHYCFLVWGHGTGYRSANLDEDNRAVALDDGSDSFMENCVVASSIQSAMGGTKLDMLIYDTCFASELEVCYEFQNAATCFVGSQGIQNESGLNYENIFSSKIYDCENGFDAAKMIIENLGEDMKNDFSVINLSEIKNVFSSFDSFSEEASACIKSKSSGEEIRNQVLKEVQNFKSFESANNPVYVNVISFVNFLSKKYEALSVTKELVLQSIKRAVLNYQGTNENLPLGIYFCSVDSSNNIIDSFSPYYFNGSNLKNQCSFVKDSKNYVLTIEKKGTLLDKVFSNFNF